MRYIVLMPWTMGPRESTARPLAGDQQPLITAARPGGEQAPERISCAAPLQLPLSNPIGLAAPLPR